MAAIDEGLGTAARGWFARHPEWWMLAASLAAWVMLALAPSNPLLPLCTAAGLTEAAIPGIVERPLSAHLLAWAAMVVAMMPPLVILSVRHIAFRSFRRRRHRAIGGFLAGYLGTWLIAGPAFLPVAMLAPALSPMQRAVVVSSAFGAAIAWQLTPRKLSALWRCHRTVSLPPLGWCADLACLRFGAGIAASCLMSCWAMMASLLAVNGAAAMGCVAAAMIHERYQPRARPALGGSILLLAVALLFALREVLT